MSENKKIIRIFEKVIEKHKNTFKKLEPFDILEYDIAQYVLQHKEGLQDKMNALKKDKSEFFPTELYHVYLDQYTEEALSSIRNEISKALNLDPEQSLRVTKEVIGAVAPDLLLMIQDDSKIGDTNGQN